MNLVCMRSCLAFGSLLGLICSSCSLISGEPSNGTLVDRKPFDSLASEFCLDCHEGPDSEARLDLSTLLESPVAAQYSDWRRVQRVLHDGAMPPPDYDQPQSDAFESAKASVSETLRAAIEKAASDPGPSQLRRLTNAEYEYCIEDLTGVDFDFRKLLISDSVGGSGFTNSASAQFMNDANLERYLEAAKLVADHAMIGAGPLYFNKDPGLTGLELSAVNRIQDIYRRFGFRASAGEGAKPYGLERYATAFWVAWKYRHRAKLDTPNATLESLAVEAGLGEKFARHIWNVMHQKEASFPLSLIVEKWWAMPTPTEMPRPNDTSQRYARELFEEMQEWQNRLAHAAGQEEAALLTGRRIDVPTNIEFKARATRKLKVRKREDILDLTDPEIYDSDGKVQLALSVEHASQDVGAGASVVFSNPQFRFDLFDGTDLEPVPLKTVLSESQIANLGFGANPGGVEIGAEDFAIQSGKRKILVVQLPQDVRYGELTVEARLDPMLGKDSVVRATIADVTSEYDPQLGVGSREYSALLRDTKSGKMDEWEAGITEFAKALPQISHREPTPSDRDPILTLYDNTYNLPERNFFHTAVKYHRDDAFLKEKILSDQQARLLDIAWTDLLTSFSYHGTNLRFASQKFNVEVGDEGIEADLDLWIQDFPSEARAILSEQKKQYDAMQRQLRDARERHRLDVISFASRAWRRPLTDSEKSEFQSFYFQLVEKQNLEHRQAIKSMLVKVLVSPEFLYRLEKVHVGKLKNKSELKPKQKTAAISSYELASRLSFSIWSSIPDEELKQCAENDSLLTEKVLIQQVERMLASPKSRRLATEFCGQWLGFYHFDEFRGVDAKRFPEFDESLRNSLYGEAISFFEFLIREDRPYQEIVQANYTFLNARSANHYGIALQYDEPSSSEKNAEYAMDYRDKSAGERFLKVNFDEGVQRGGLFGLAAMLTSTSAPLRTSPVKRGDWILRRLIGTPVPPPPADAGSIAAEEVLSDGLTVRERLESHRTQQECMGCHVRIDPLGFALENFDSLGRWRDTYADAQEIDASGQLSSGETITGFDGLRKHLADRDTAFRRTFATKLVAYFTGRAETVSDAKLIDKIAIALEDNPRISTAIKTIAKSDQFRRKRLLPVSKD